MFDIGFWEMTLIGVIALLVIGPERLPGLVRTVGLWVGRIRRYVAQVRDDIEREVHAEELKQLLDKPEGLDDLYDVVEETKDTLNEAKKSLQAAEKSVQSQADEWTRSIEPVGVDGNTTSNSEESKAAPGPVLIEENVSAVPGESPTAGTDSLTEGVSSTDSDSNSSAVGAGNASDHERRSRES